MYDDKEANLNKRAGFDDLGLDKIAQVRCVVVCVVSIIFGVTRSATAFSAFLLNFNLTARKNKLLL